MITTQNTTDTPPTPIIRIVCKMIWIYGVTLAIPQIIWSLQTGRQLALGPAALYLYLAFVMNGPLRQSARWAWWVTVLAGSLLAVRYTLGCLVVLLSVVTHLHLYTPAVITLYVTHFVFAGPIVICLLTPSGRAPFFPRKTQDNYAPTGDGVWLPAPIQSGDSDTSA